MSYRFHIVGIEDKNSLLLLSVITLCLLNSGFSMLFIKIKKDIAISE